MDKALDQVRACLSSGDGHALILFFLMCITKSPSVLDGTGQSLLHSIPGGPVSGIPGHRDIAVCNS